MMQKQIKIKRQTKIKKDSNNNIPSKYLCPITKQMMAEPVTFDGYTYERNALQYLKKHNKSPQTQQQAHTLCLFPNLQIQQEIETYKAVKGHLINPNDDDTQDIE